MNADKTKSMMNSHQSNLQFLISSQWAVCIRNRFPVLFFNTAGDPGSHQTSHVSHCGVIFFFFFLTCTFIFFRERNCSLSLLCLCVVPAQYRHTAAPRAEGPAAQLLHQCGGCSLAGKQCRGCGHAGNGCGCHAGRAI